MHPRTNRLPTPRRLVALVVATLTLVTAASTVRAFSTGSPVCKVTAAEMTANQGTPIGVGTGGFVVSVLRAGNPVTTIVPGETLQIRVSHPANVAQRGLLMWVDDAGGTRIGSFTAPSGTQLTPGCGLSSITHSSPNPVTVRTVSWTVPSVHSGTATVSAVIVASSRNDWYGPLTTTLQTAAASPVPGLHTWALLLASLALIATAYRRLRSAGV